MDQIRQQYVESIWLSRLYFIQQDQYSSKILSTQELFEIFSYRLEAEGGYIMSKKKTQQSIDGFAATITLRNGRVIHAKDYGYEAFPLRNRKNKRK